MLQPSIHLTHLFIHLTQLFIYLTDLFIVLRRRPNQPLKKL